MPLRLTIKILLLLFAGLSFLGCKKSILNITEIQTPESSFKTYITDLAFLDKKISKTITLDSPFYFESTNQSGDSIKYEWDFGDGTTSALQKPKHVYAATGNYKVKLTTSRKDLAFDSSEATVSVITGEKAISLGKSITTAAINIIETKDNNFLLLGYSFDFNIFPEVNSYFLMKLDKNLKEKSRITFPEGLIMKTISACKDGNYILSGTTSGKTNSTELIKMAEDGTLIWSKTINCQNITDARESDDNGFILTATRTIRIGYNDLPRTLIIKTDASGNLLWERFFNDEFILNGTFNSVEDNGYVFGAVKKRDGGIRCNNCDSLTVVKLDIQGKLLWKNTVAWGLNEEAPGNVSISKMKNGNYNIIGSRKLGLYIFSPSGVFTDRKIISYAATANTTDVDGGIYVLQEEFGNGMRSTLSGYYESGIVKWKIYINGCETISEGYAACNRESWPVTVKPIKAGGVIFVSNKFYYNSNRRSIAISKVGNNGAIL
jgi:PKD repeat protein